MAGLGIFRRIYTVRRFGKQEYVEEGYATAPFHDFKVDLNVQTTGSHSIQSNPEGIWHQKTLKSYGDFPFSSADQNTGVMGDMLFYKGQWYTCISSVSWDHSLLYHYKAEWSAVAETDSAEFLKPPREEEHTHEPVRRKPPHHENSENVLSKGNSGLPKPIPQSETRTPHGDNHTHVHSSGTTPSHFFD